MKGVCAKMLHICMSFFPRTAWVQKQQQLYQHHIVCKSICEVRALTTTPYEEQDMGERMVLAEITQV